MRRLLSVFFFFSFEPRYAFVDGYEGEKAAHVLTRLYDIDPRVRP